MFPRLDFTSPHLRDPRVKEAQHLLKHNRWGIDFMPHSEIDGEFGKDTAHAVHEAKFYLGYERGTITATFGPNLYGFLISKKRKGHKLLPPLYHHRMKKRKKEHLTVSGGGLGMQALRVAQAQIGVNEYPYGSNRVKYTEWYGIIGPWCAMFESWCFAQIGGHFRYSYVPTINSDAVTGRNGLSVTSSPRPGDLVLYDFPGLPLSHTGFFEHWVSAGIFSTVEGNTSAESDANGGEVERRTRYTSQVHHFVRVLS